MVDSQRVPRRISRCTRPRCRVAKTLAMVMLEVTTRAHLPARRVPSCRREDSIIASRRYFRRLDSWCRVSVSFSPVPCLSSLCLPSLISIAWKVLSRYIDTSSPKHRRGKPWWKCTILNERGQVCASHGCISHRIFEMAF